MSAGELSAPAFGLRPDRQLRRRRLTDRAATAFLALILLAVLAVLLWVLVFVAEQGLRYLGPAFLTQTPPGNPADGGGGFENGIIGSLIIVGLASALSVPTGIAAGIYLAEYSRGRITGLVRFIADLMTGIPTIVLGAFVYALWVTRFGFSGYAGAIALALVMFPLIVRTSEEMLKLVPNDLREASLALGASRARTALTVVVPSALSGIITGVMLAVARAMGETAPLLLTALGNDLFVQTNPGQRMSTLSLQIFGNAITGFQAAQNRAWAGALTLIAIVLILTVVARFASRRRLAGTRI